MPSIDISKLTQQQQIIYTFLQSLYEKEITGKFLIELPKKIKPLKDIIESISNVESRQMVEELIKYIDSIPLYNLEDLRTTLAADYARLFLSLNKVPAHPSESTYREGTMMQHYRDDVLQTYWSFGVSAKKEFTEPEDHIATELSFMAYLCGMATEALKKGDAQEAKKFVQAHRDFLKMHLIIWVPGLVKDISNTAETPFYKGIAALTKEFIEINILATEDVLNQLN